MVMDGQQKHLPAGFDPGGLQMLRLLDTEGIPPKNIMFKEMKNGI